METTAAICDRGLVCSVSWVILFADGDEHAVFLESSSGRWTFSGRVIIMFQREVAHGADQIHAEIRRGIELIFILF